MRGLASKPASAEQSNSPFRSYGSRKSAVQTKLQVNKPGDAHEMEADQAAEKVVNQPENTEMQMNKPGDAHEMNGDHAVEKVVNQPKGAEIQVNKSNEAYVPKADILFTKNGNQPKAADSESVPTKTTTQTNTAFYPKKDLKKSGEVKTSDQINKDVQKDEVVNEEMPTEVKEKDEKTKDLINEPSNLVAAEPKDQKSNSTNSIDSKNNSGDKTSPPVLNTTDNKQSTEKQTFEQSNSSVEIKGKETDQSQQEDGNVQETITEPTNQKATTPVDQKLVSSEEGETKDNSEEQDQSLASNANVDSESAPVNTGSESSEGDLMQEEVEEENSEGDFFPEFNTASELKKLRAEIEHTKALVKSNVKSRKLRVENAERQEEKRIGLRLFFEAYKVSKKYDSSILKVKQKVDYQKKRIERERLFSIARVEKLTDKKLKVLDNSVLAKQEKILRIGNIHAYQIKKYSSEMKLTAYRAYYRQKEEMQNEALRIAKQPKYSGNKEKVWLIRGELLDMAEGTKETISDVIQELNDTLDENSDEMADNFRTSAEEASDALPEGTSEVASQIEQMRDEIIKMITKAGVKEIQDLDNHANQTIADLKKSKKNAINALQSQAKEAKASMSKMVIDFKKQLDNYQVKLSKTLDQALGDAEDQAPDLPDELAASLVGKVRKANKQALTNDTKNGEASTKNMISQLSRTRGLVTKGISGFANSCIQTANRIVVAYNTISKQVANGIIKGFKTLEKAAGTEMSKGIREFAKGLDDLISKADSKWKYQQAKNKKGLKIKTFSVIKENQNAANATMKEMLVRSKYLWQSSKLDRIADNIVAFVGGILSFLWDMVLIILAVIIIIVAIIATILVLVEVIVALVTLLFGELVGLIISNILYASLVFVAELMITFFTGSFFTGLVILLTGIGVGIGLYSVYTTYNKKGLSGKERWASFGQGFAEIATSFELGWVTKLKIFKFGGKMKQWKWVKNFFGDTKTGKSFVKFSNRSVKLANDISKKFAGYTKELQATYKNFKNGMHLQSVMGKMGNDAKKLSELMVLAGNDTGMLNKALTHMKADEISDAMMYFDNMADMLAALKNSGKKNPAKFLEDLGKGKTDFSSKWNKLSSTWHNPSANPTTIAGKTDDPARVIPENVHPETGTSSGQTADEVGDVIPEKKVESVSSSEPESLNSEMENKSIPSSNKKLDEGIGKTDETLPVVNEESPLSSENLGATDESINTSNLEDVTIPNPTKRQIAFEAEIQRIESSLDPGLAADLRKYNKLNPSGTLSIDNVVKKFKDEKKVLNSRGDFYDPVKKKKPDYEATFIDDINIDHADFSPEKQAELKAIIARRKKAVKEREAARKHPGEDSQQFKDAEKAVISASEDLGNTSTLAVIELKYPGSKPLAFETPGGKQGQFDYVFEHDGNIYIMESKGGSSTRGSRKVTDGKRAEQGTPQYRDEIVKIMLNSGISDVQETAIKIQNAIDGIDGATINYIQVTQKVNHSTGEIISKTRIQQFSN
ncbi:MAG: hypothetical protein FGM14_12505 [Flavobacteriales bacterium]|nr:hypothetical protein [Flavobacteriales bacterium]